MIKKSIDTLTRPLKNVCRNKYCRGAIAFVRYLFLPALVTFLLLLLIDIVFPDSVSRYLNLNHWLIGIIVLGVITVLTQSDNETGKAQTHSIRNDVIPIICFGLVGATIVWYQTRDIGWLSYLVSPVSGILIVLLTLIIWQEPEEEKGEDENSPDN